MLIVETVGRLQDDGGQEVEEEELRGELGEHEVVVVKTLLVHRALVPEEEIEEAAECDAEDDEQTGLRHLGRDDVRPVEAQLGQAGQDDEAHHGQVVLHLLPSPPDQAE